MPLPELSQEVQIAIGIGLGVAASLPTSALVLKFLELRDNKRRQASLDWYYGGSGWQAEDRGTHAILTPIGSTTSREFGEDVVEGIVREIDPSEGFLSSSSPSSKLLGLSEEKADLRSLEWPSDDQVLPSL